MTPPLISSTPSRRAWLMLQGAIALYEESQPDIAALLAQEPALFEAFDLLGCALRWAARELGEGRPDRRR